MDEGKASQGSNDKMEREKDESREDRTQDKAMDEDLEMDESTTLEGSQAISAKKPLDDLVFLHEEKNEKENGQTKSSLMDDSTVKTEDKSEKNDPNGIPNVKNVGDENKRSQEHIDSEDCESEIVPMKRTEIDQEDAKEDAEENGSVTCGTTEMDAFEIVHTKLCLQDHLDSIEVELNQRMDEIESNLDGRKGQFFVVAILFFSTFSYRCWKRCKIPVCILPCFQTKDSSGLIGPLSSHTGGLRPWASFRLSIEVIP